MDEALIKSLVKKAGTRHKYQYISLLIIFLLYGTTEFITISLPFLESKPIVGFTDSNGIYHEQLLNYKICAEHPNFVIVKESNSIIMYSGLICDQVGTSLIGMCLFIGVMTGSFFLNLFSDWIGRKKTILLFSLMYICVLIVSSFIQDKYLIYVTMFFIGLFYIVVILTSLILFNEMISEDLTSIFTTIIYNAYFLFGIFYGYFFTVIDCRLIYRYVAVLHLIFLGIFYYYCEESLYYYITKNDKNNFFKTLDKIAKKNGQSLDEIDRIKMDDFNINDKESFAKKRKESDLSFDTTQYKLKMKSLEEYGIADLLKYDSQRYNFLILCFLWFISSFIFYGLSINIKNISGDIYTNMIIVYTFDIICTSLVSVISNTAAFGRTKTITLLLLISFISNMLYKFKPADNNSSEFYENVLLVSQYSYTCIFGILYFVSSEIYPTVLRARGLGYNSAAGRIGGIIAPMIIEHIHNDLLVNILILFTLFGMMFSFFISETYGQDIRNKLPEEDGVRYSTF